MTSDSSGLPLEAAASVLSEALGTTVRLDVVEAFHEEHGVRGVARCKVAGSDSSPATVFLKRHRTWALYEPDKPGGPADGLLTEWAALEWLSELGVDVVPRLLCADREHGFLVISDIAHKKRVDHVLLGEDPGEAKAALVSMATSLGKLHAATIGSDANEWHRRRTALGPVTDDAREGRFDKPLAAFRHACEALDIDIGNTDDDIERICQSIVTPGPMHALIHGDPCPDNLLVTDDNVIIIDFEVASWWFAPRDAVYARVPFPTCWCMGLIPESVVDDVEAAYRATAGFIDDKEWTQHVALATAQWFFMSVPDLVLRAMDSDREWGTTGLRARVAPRCEAFTTAARRAGVLEELADTSERFRDKASALWPTDSAIQSYPAFRK